MNAVVNSLTNPVDHAHNSAHDLGEAAMRKLRNAVATR
jgi:hypothetical protein